MKRAKLFVWVIFVVGTCLVAGCARHDESLPSQDTNRKTVTHSPSSEKEMTAEEYQRAKEAALAQSKKEYEEKVRHPELITNRPPSEWPFPNYQAGPHNPRPIHVNFYCIDDHYPDYLLCAYDVEEKHYTQTNEPEWFNAALKQMLRSGPKEFPPLKWVAIMIVNRAEYKKDVSTFEQPCKVAAIFKASDVFDSSHDLAQLVAHAKMDLHPFKYDTQQPTPGEQQRWVIVERHAAANKEGSPNKRVTYEK